jgi:hypothetical protein
MKKACSATLMFLILLLSTSCRRDAAPAGEGSYAAAKVLLAEIAGVPPGTMPPGFIRFECQDGSWIAGKGIDSHHGPDGGTAALVTSTGESTIVFTHICGPGDIPLSGLFETSGSTTGSPTSATAALATIRSRYPGYQPGP